MKTCTAESQKPKALVEAVAFLTSFWRCPVRLSAEMQTVLGEKFPQILLADVEIVPGIIPRGLAGEGGGNGRVLRHVTDEAAKGGRVQEAKIVANRIS